MIAYKEVKKVAGSAWLAIRKCPKAYWALFLILLLFTRHALFYFFSLGGRAVDDAYISFRYAQNFVEGHGLVFNPGEKVEGFTNFLWTILMIPFQALGLDLGRLSMLIGVLFGLGVLCLVFYFSKIIEGKRNVELGVAEVAGLQRLNLGDLKVQPLQLKGSTSAIRSFGLAAALFLAADGSFALWSVSGLETAMFAFLILAGAILYCREQQSARWPFSAVLFALAAMTRPEGALIFAVTVVHQIVWRLLQKKPFISAPDLGRLLVFGGIFLPYWVGRTWYYGSFLPNSFIAKVSTTFPASQITRGWNYLAQFIQVHLGWLILLPPIASILGSLKVNGRFKLNFQLFWTSYFILLIGVYAAYIVIIGGDWSVGRFFVPILAPFYLLCAVGCYYIAKWLAVRLKAVNALLKQRYVIAFLCIILAILGLWFSSYKGENELYVQKYQPARATEAREAMGKWLKANVPAGTLIAVDAAGQIPYFSQLPAIDMFGINDWYISHSESKSGQDTAGHERGDWAYVIGRAPQYVVTFGNAFYSVKEYAWLEAPWTDKAELKSFLSLYVRR